MYIGIDIGGTKLLAAASNDGRRMIRSQKIATPKEPRKALTAMVELVHQVAGDKPIASVGVSTPGPLDLHKGIILEPPNLPWRNLEIKRLLEKQLNAHVVVQHDAACGGLAEARIGAGKDYERVLYVTISTGIGVSLIEQGQLFHGAKSNVEAGHITVVKDGPECSCGAPGHFEAIASGRAIKKQFGKNAYEIKDAKTWDQIAQNMAAGLASLIAVYAPDVIVLAGGVSVHWRKFQRPLAHYLAKDYRYGIPTIRIAKYIETAPVLGALLLASQSEELLL